MATKSTLATELKDLDVDRVDGVDRPATGRAWALFKNKQGDTTMPDTITKDELQALLKNYAAVATAADLLLKAVRKDAKGSVSKATAIACNGLAQIMGADPVFKAVPGIAQQPYEIEDPMRDENKRGPADESIGSNFTPRSMPGSMVGKVQFSVKSADVVDKAFPPAVEGDEKKPAPAMPWDEAKMSKAIADGVAATLKSMGIAAPVEKIVKTEDKPVVVAPASKQPADNGIVTLDAATVAVRKGAGFRMGASFDSLVFGKQGLSA